MKAETKKQLALGLLASSAFVAIMAIGAGVAQAEPVRIQIADDKNEIVECDCEWVVLDGNGEHYATFNGSRLDQDFPAGKYEVYIDKLSTDEALSLFIEVPKGGAYIETVSLFKYY